jgi:hypothetical protein
VANVVNQCPANYGYSYLYGQFRHSTDTTAHADGISQGVYGIRKPNAPHQLYWCRDLTTVHLIQDTIVGKFGEPLYEIEIEDTTLKRMHVDVGDAITYSADSLYGPEGNPLIDTIWRVISVRPDFAAGKITFRALQIFYRAVVPAVPPYVWDGILLLTVPDLFTILTVATPEVTKIEEDPVAPDDPIALDVPAVPIVAVSAIVHVLIGECTISRAAPCVVGFVAHGLLDGDQILFKTTGALPAPLTVGAYYYVKDKAADSFNISLTSPGSAIDTTTDGSGVHSLYAEA